MDNKIGIFLDKPARCLSPVPDPTAFSIRWIVREAEGFPERTYSATAAEVQVGPPSIKSGTHTNTSWQDNNLILAEGFDQGTYEITLPDNSEYVFVKGNLNVTSGGTVAASLYDAQGQLSRSVPIGTYLKIRTTEKKLGLTLTKTNGAPVLEDVVIWGGPASESSQIVFTMPPTNDFSQANELFVSYDVAKCPIVGFRDIDTLSSFTDVPAILTGLDRLPVAHDVEHFKSVLSASVDIHPVQKIYQESQGEYFSATLAAAVQITEVTKPTP